MIIIKNANLETVLKTINTERTFLEGLNDSLRLVEKSSPEILEDIFAYIKHNAVFNGISERARREISSKHDFFQTLSFGANNAIYLLNDIEDRLKKSRIKIFDTTTITYQQKGMFDWINAINFFSGYASKIIDVCLTQPKTISNYLTKADFEFINKTVNYFNIVLKRLCDSQRDLKRSLDMLSDEVYDPNEVGVIEELKGRQAASIGLAPHHFNPNYWRRYALMTRDVRKIKSNREKIDMYAMKLQRLENKRNNSQDPSIDRQIEYWQNEIQILDAEIADIEEKYRENV